MRPATILALALFVGCGATPTPEVPHAPEQRVAYPIDPSAVQLFWEHVTAASSLYAGAREAWAGHFDQQLECYEGRAEVASSELLEERTRSSSDAWQRRPLEVTFEAPSADLVRARGWFHSRRRDIQRVEPRVVELRRTDDGWRISAERQFGADCGTPAGIERMEIPAAIDTCATGWRACQEIDEPFAGQQCDGELLRCVQHELQGGQSVLPRRVGVSRPTDPAVLRPGHCGESGFCVVYPEEALFGVTRLAGRAADDLWAVSYAGLFHFDGTSWRHVESGAEDAHLVDLALSPEGQPVLLVGDRGEPRTVHRRSDGEWTSHTLPEGRRPDRLLQVGDALFAWGYRGRLLEMRGSSWVPSPHLADADIASVFRQAEATFVNTPGLRIEGPDGAPWTRTIEPYSWRAALPDADGSTRLFGERRERPPFFAESRMSFRRPDPEAPPLPGVAARLDLDGTLRVVGATPAVFDVVRASGQELWALGDRFLYRKREPAGAWEAVELPSAFTALTRATDLWVGGGQVFVSHANGVFQRSLTDADEGWTQHGASRARVQSHLVYRGPDDVTLLRNRRLLRWDGSAWSAVGPLRERSEAQALAVLSDTEAVVLESRTQTAWLTNGEWRTVEHPELERLWPLDEGLFAQGSEDDDHTLYRFVDGRWERHLAVDPEEDIVLVDGPRRMLLIDDRVTPHRLIDFHRGRRRLLRRIGSSTDIQRGWRQGRELAVTLGYSQLLTFDGRRWTERPLTNTSVRTGFIGSQLDDLYFGSDYSVVRLGGEGAERLDVPGRIRGLVGTAADLWLLTGDGTVLRRRVTPP